MHSQTSLYQKHLQLVELLLFSRKVLGLNPRLGSFCTEFVCAHHAYVGSPASFHSQKNKIKTNKEKTWLFFD